MILTLLLPWFLVVLGAGVGGRLLGRRRGYALGLLCGLFWIVLVSASMGIGVWRDPGTAATLLTGALAILAIGGWAGESGDVDRARRIATATSPSMNTRSGHPEGSGRRVLCETDREPLAQLSAGMDRFDDWLTRHRADANPWPAFDEFLRGVLYECCGATHVRPYRLTGDGDRLSPLTDADSWAKPQTRSPRKGIIGHVVTTGRSFIAGMPGQGDLLARLAATSSEPMAWCFPIKHGAERLGVVTVGDLDLAPEQHVELLRGTQRLARLFWNSLHEVRRSRAAVLDDPVSGLHLRDAFLHTAEQSLRESYQQSEPVAVVVVAFEGLRRLTDAGRWETADELVSALGRELRRKVRLDDCTGRFDGSRFAILLRRVDSGLASLIVDQLLLRLAQVCADEERWQVPLTVRCGVVGSGVENPDLRTLLARALTQCHRARTEGIAVASDLHSDLPEGAGAPPSVESCIGASGTQT